MIYCLFGLSLLVTPFLLVLRNHLLYFHDDNRRWTGVTLTGMPWYQTFATIDRPDWVLYNRSTRWLLAFTQGFLLFFIPFLVVTAFYSGLQVWLNAMDSIDRQNAVIRELAAYQQAIEQRIKPFKGLLKWQFVLSLAIFGLTIAAPALGRLQLSKYIGKTTRWLGRFYFVLSLFSLFTFFGARQVGEEQAKAGALRVQIDATDHRYRDAFNRSVEKAIQQATDEISAALKADETEDSRQKMEDDVEAANAAALALQRDFPGFKQAVDIGEFQKAKDRSDWSNAFAALAQIDRQLDELQPPSGWPANAPEWPVDPQPVSPAGGGGPGGGNNPAPAPEATPHTPASGPQQTPTQSSRLVFPSAEERGNWSQASAEHVQKAVSEPAAATIEGEAVKNISAEPRSNTYRLYRSVIRKAVSAALYHGYEKVRIILSQNPMVAAIADGIYLETIGPSTNEITDRVMKTGTGRAKKPAEKITPKEALIKADKHLDALQREMMAHNRIAEQMKQSLTKDLENLQNKKAEQEQRIREKEQRERAAREAKIAEERRIKQAREDAFNRRRIDEARGYSENKNSDFGVECTCLCGGVPMWTRWVASEAMCRSLCPTGAPCRGW